jgi:hypothetical protein
MDTLPFNKVATTRFVPNIFTRCVNFSKEAPHSNPSKRARSSPAFPRKIMPTFPGNVHQEGWYKPTRLHGVITQNMKI